MVEGLLQSSRLFDVRLGLDMLTHAEHETLNNHLLNLVRHPNIQLRIEALKRIEHHRPENILFTIADNSRRNTYLITCILSCTKIIHVSDETC